jgi:hypothetical protein
MLVDDAISLLCLHCQKLEEIEALLEAIMLGGEDDKTDSEYTRIKAL